jgi:surfeit locus 1 family protein
VTGRLWAFVGLAVALAALFIRLAFWQLRRLDERRTVNAGVAERLRMEPVSIGRLSGDRQFRRVIIVGVPDFDNEFVHTGRSRNGSPGVHIITPVRGVANDTAILVNRGWVYAADAATIDLSRWRDTLRSFTGFLVTLPSPAAGSADSLARGRVRALTSKLRRALPYPVGAEYLVAQDSAGRDSPVRLAQPALDNGPHLSYAIQWFCFAFIALGGAGIVMHRARRGGIGGSTGA